MRALSAAVLAGLMLPALVPGAGVASDRQAMLADIERRLGSHLDEPAIAACMDQAGLGSDRALYALGTIADAREAMAARTAFIERALRSNSDPHAVTRELERWSSEARYQRVLRASAEMPEATAYCEAVLNAINRHNDADEPPRDAALRWLEQIESRNAALGAGRAQ
ncbi:hypothetical protein J2T57_001322 [Natronocella acetinitrilica]|uniref:Uncharacterized protein n=1 Tax=Natronocella acetinitrilica TaxID=414046 RepID=A0AAE3G203_9GAMM|nr:hypothetical protein [Natronocella acetinitrilica]MCP1674220.1 hypothetical protein [Natronocella acetinitrilica]